MLLALDSATDAVTVALHDGTSVVAEHTEEDRLRHGERLAPAIARVLADAGVRPGDLTRIAVGVGPGPFTGLRIGIVTATTMAAALGIEAVGVCTLDVIASAVRAKGPFLVATDARRKEVYWSTYTSPGERRTHPAVGFPADIATDLPVAGNGPLLYPADLPNQVAPRLPSAADLARLVASGAALPTPTRRDGSAGAQAGHVTDIRDATPADLEPVSALDVALFGADGWGLAAMGAEFAAVGQTRTVLVAASGAEVVGYAILLTVGDLADVQRIGVAAGSQRKGLGGRLLEELVRRAVSAGHPKVLLEVGARNAPALAFYRSHGFAEISRRPGYYRDGDDALVLVREVSA